MCLQFRIWSVGCNSTTQSTNQRCHRGKCKTPRSHPQIKPGAGRLGKNRQKKHRNLAIFDGFLAENLPAPHLPHPKIAKFEHWGREISQSRPGGGNAATNVARTPSNHVLQTDNHNCYGLVQTPVDAECEANALTTTLMKPMIHNEESIHIKYGTHEVADYLVCTSIILSQSRGHGSRSPSASRTAPPSQSRGHGSGGRSASCTAPRSPIRARSLTPRRSKRRLSPVQDGSPRPCSKKAKLELVKVLKMLSDYCTEAVKLGTRGVKNKALSDFRDTSIDVIEAAMKIVNGLLPDDERVPVDPGKRIPKSKPFETTYLHRFPDKVERLVVYLGSVNAKNKKKVLPVFQLETYVQAVREVFKQKIAPMHKALATGEIEKLAAVAPAKMQPFGVQPWPKDKASGNPRAACLKPSAMIVIPPEPSQQAPEAFTLAALHDHDRPRPQVTPGEDGPYSCWRLGTEASQH